MQKNTEYPYWYSSQRRSSSSNKPNLGDAGCPPFVQQARGSGHPDTLQLSRTSSPTRTAWLWGTASSRGAQGLLWRRRVSTASRSTPHPSAKLLIHLLHIGLVCNSSHQAHTTLWVMSTQNQKQHQRHAKPHIPIDFHWLWGTALESSFFSLECYTELNTWPRMRFGRNNFNKTKIVKSFGFLSPTLSNLPPPKKKLKPVLLYVLYNAKSTPHGRQLRSFSYVENSELGLRNIVLNTVMCSTNISWLKTIMETPTKMEYRYYTKPGNI